MLYFDQCQVNVNNTGIICQNASLGTENGIQPIQILNYRGAIDQTISEKYNSSLNLSYLHELNNDPIHTIVDFYKTGTNFTLTPIPISLGGISGSYFLNGYNLKIKSNEIGQATASFTSFELLSGNLETGINKNSLISSGFSHGLTTTIPGSLNINEFNYSFKTDIAPIYCLGNNFPTQIELINSEEEIDLSTDSYVNLDFSGISLKNTLSADSERIILNEIGYMAHTKTKYPDVLYQKIISITNSKHKSVTLEAGLDNKVFVNIKAKNYF